MKSAINKNEATANTQETAASTANHRRRDHNLNKNESSPLLKPLQKLIINNHFKDVSLCGNAENDLGDDSLQENGILYSPS